mgnify:CR=1 FL=1
MIILKKLVKSITYSQENYAEKFGKDKSIQSDSIKRKERIKNIDVELENWRNLKSNSEKMISELNERRNKLQLEWEENQKNPERIANSKGKNLQNLENTKKALKHGINASVVFKDKLPATFLGYNVIDGDENDLRFLDKKEFKSVIGEEIIRKIKEPNFILLRNAEIMKKIKWILFMYIVTMF